MNEKARKIKAIFFDIGGVVIRDAGLKQSLFRVFQGVPEQDVWDAVNKDVLLACRGGVSLADCWRALARKFQLQIPEAEISSLWIDDYQRGISINEDVWGLVQELKSRGHCLGVISNTINEHAVILRNFGVYEPFSPVILSHEVGLTKDSAEIFHLALDKAGVGAHESVFIDDVPAFAEVARSIGMHSLVYGAHDALIEALRSQSLID